MAFGVTPQGFSLKRLEDIKTEMEQDLQAELGTNINLLPEEVLGQLVGIISEREALLWELAEAIYDSQYPDTSEGVPLDNVSSITGAIRKTPTKSQIIGQLLFGTLGTIIPTGSIVSVTGAPSSRFETLSNVTLVVGVDEIQDIGFDDDPDSGDFKIAFGGQTTGAIAWNATASAVQSALEALSTIGSGNVSVSGSISLATGLTVTFLNSGPTGLGKRDVDTLSVVDNNLLKVATPVNTTVTETTKGVPQGEVNMEAEDTGATDAPTGTLTVIESPIAGWDSTANPEDAILGQDVEEDAEFRLRRKEQVAEAGAATINAIVSDLLALDDVIAVVVFQNNTAVVDPDGRPPHSLDIVVQGGDEDEVAEQIFDSVAGGITMIGDITKIVIDSQSFSQTVKFSRPTEVEIYVEVDLSIDADEFPVDGAAQVEQAILEYGNALGIGEDVVVFGSSPSLSCAFSSIPGITDYVVRVGKAASPTTDDNVEMEPRELADFDSARITVTVP